MANRWDPRPHPSPSGRKTPASSGPRCARACVITSTTLVSRAPTIPAMPHKFHTPPLADTPPSGNTDACRTRVKEAMLMQRQARATVRNLVPGRSTQSGNSATSIYPILESWNARFISWIVLILLQTPADSAFRSSLRFPTSLTSHEWVPTVLTSTQQARSRHSELDPESPRMGSPYMVPQEQH